jgi:hypothetical protein
VAREVPDHVTTPPAVSHPLSSARPEAIKYAMATGRLDVDDEQSQSLNQSQ